ncbi:MAG TPA: DUF6753 family protein [Coleofasciculaceae cyanobacterium]|jgi:hypothetical protein
MSLLDGSAAKARKIIDFCMPNEPPEMKAKVFEIVNLSGLEPNDPMFMVLLSTGQIRVFLEAAPRELRRLLEEWKLEMVKSFSRLMSAMTQISEQQQEQALVLEEKMETVSQKCVSNIKEAGMSTVGAMAEANSETLEQVKETKQQNEELSKTLATLQAEAKADREKNIENMNALIVWMNKTVQRQENVNQQINDSYADLRKLQQKTLWFKFADWYSPLSALVIVGGACFIAGGWLTFQKYNGAIDQLGRNIATWNLDRIVKCQDDKNPKCTVWIVPPGSPEREGVE